MTKAHNKKRGRATRPDKKAVESAGAAASAPLPVPAGSDPIVRLDAPPPADRNLLGQWVRGQSGNPKGKARGLKNFVTLERLALEAALRSYIASDGNLDKVLKGFDRLFGIIETGGDKEAIAAFKVLADKLMTAPKESGEEQQGPQQLTVVITQARGGDEPAMRVIDPQDADFEEVPTEDEEA